MSTEIAAGVMPLIAQNFVDSRSNSSFNFMIASGDNNNNNDYNASRDDADRDSPRHLRQIAKMPTRASRENGKDFSSRREPDPRHTSANEDARAKAEADGIYYWPDDTFLNKFFFVDEVGFGNWGSLWLSYVEPDRQSPAAVKVVHRLKDTSSAARVKALWNEYKCIRALRSTSHPNLIAFHSFILTPSFAVVHMDYHPSLITVSIPESRVKLYGRQILSAVEHLHVHGITHNDIKPSNILLAADDRPVLIDFGFAQQWDTRSPDRFLSSLSWGTVEYLSPERAQGRLHDERLSDVWAIGITLYELVVGRTPFEENEEETVLDRAQLERYYHRTLTGEFCGDFIISKELENLVRLMIAADPGLRLQSCGQALKHRFFNLAPSRLDERIHKTSTSTRKHEIESTSKSSKTPIKSSSGKIPPRSTPKKKAEKGFAIFQDDDAPSPARTGRSASPFSPRSKPLGNATNHSHALAEAIPPLSKVTSALPSKTPPRSRIPIRKPVVLSPSVKAPPVNLLAARTFIADTSSPVPPIPPSYVATEKVGTEAERTLEDQPLTNSSSGLIRSTSINSVRRKPVPALFDESFELADQSGSSLAGNAADQPVDREEEEEVLSSNRTSPVFFDGPKEPELSSSLGSKTSRFLKKSFAKKASTQSGFSPSGRSEVAFPKSSTSPLQRKLSKGLGRVRKLSTPLRHLQRPSLGGLSSLKRSVSAIARRRGTSTESSYSLIEGETLRGPRTTTPTRSQGPAIVDAEAQKARLAAFSAHVQQILEVRNSMDTPRSPLSERPVEIESRIASTEQTSPQQLGVSVATPLGSIEEASVVRTPREKKQPGSPSPPPSPKRSFLRMRSSRSSKSQSPSPPTIQRSKPGHRRIPTAIRNVPSVVLYESSDDFDSQIDCSGATATESSSARIASPPPPPRIVEPPRRLPTWVVDDSDGDEDENLTDAEDPTITIGMTPRNGKVTKGAIVAKAPASELRSETSLPIFSSPIPLEAQRVTRARPFESLDSVEYLSSDPPFHNLDSRSESRASTTHSSTLSHSRSRSVLSFFTSATSPVSTASSRDYATSTKSSVLVKGPERKKKMGRIRRVVSKVFG
ncbi:hypothetical protein JCM11491_001375 [Sporobolomyces phaffii]